MGKSKLQKAQSPINNYKRFLTQNSENKHVNSQSNMIKPQIIQRPKIQNYLTQNLPSKNTSYGDKKEKSSQDLLIKKTLSQKNMVARNSYNSNNNLHQVSTEDR